MKIFKCFTVAQFFIILLIVKLKEKIKEGL